MQRLGKMTSYFGLLFAPHRLGERDGPHLICHLSHDLISEAGIGQSSLDDVVPKQILLGAIQVWVTHKS